MTAVDELPLLGRVLASATEDWRGLMDTAQAHTVELLLAGGNPEACAVCGRTDRPLEDHHIAGKLNDDRTVPLCVGEPGCHLDATEMQRAWDQRWLKPGNPPSLKRALFILGLANLCTLRARYRDPSYEVIAKWLIRKYAELAQRAATEA